ncbi:MAG TPA: discoidin domain-containing protein [Polyangiaceae bacterium]|nr:discoidin domain-containing protein [Polyangiaceae bacterium]
MLSALRAGLREVLWLSVAERTTRSYGAECLQKVRAAKSHARLHLRASRRHANPVTALAVLAKALRFTLRATHEARAATSPFDPLRELEWLGSQGYAAASSIEAATELLSTSDEDLVQWPFAKAETWRDRVEALVGNVCANVESRTVAEIYGLRIGRALAIALAVAWLGTSWVRTHYLAHNVALHKPVTTSGLKVSPPTGAEVVDGKTRGTFGVHTSDSPQAFVSIDLERVYHVQRVRIFNRGDGWFDDVLPLTLEVSRDGRYFDPVAQRTVHFDVWTVDLGGRDARWVRVTRNNGYIALNEIEVYARQ